MRNPYSRNRGLSLPELLISVALFTLISLGTSALFKEIYSGSNQKRLGFSSVDQARIVSAAFTNELRNAATGSGGALPLNLASTTQIIFYTNYGSTAPAVNRVRYFSSGPTLYKGVTVPTGVPLTYNSANEKITVVHSALANGTSTPLFSYYDDDYNGSSTSLVQPVAPTQVRFAQMNLKLLLRTLRNATTTFNILSGAALRTLKTNLGD